MTHPDDTPTPPPSTPSRMDRLEAKLDAVIDRLPQPAPDTGWTAGLHKIADWLTGMWLTRILAALGIWALVVTIITLRQDITVRSEERADRIEEAEFRKLAQIATAWELLLTRAGGDIGKGNALNTIVEGGSQIVGADLSCEAVGIFEDGTCISPPIYTNVRFSEGSFWSSSDERQNCDFVCFDQPYVREVNFAGAHIDGFIAEQIELDIFFEGVVGSNWHVRNARLRNGLVLYNSLTNFSCRYCWFFDSTFDYSLMDNIDRPILVSSRIVVDQEPEIDESGFNNDFITLLDRVVVFEAETFVANEINARADGSEFSVADNIYWQLYETTEFCLTEEDHQILKTHLIQMSAAAVGNGDTWSFTSGEGETVTIIDDQSKANLSTKPSFTVELQKIPVTENSETVNKEYFCGFDHIHVAPLLRERVLMASAEIGR